MQIWNIDSVGCLAAEFFIPDIACLFLSLQKEDKAKFSHLDTKGIFRVEIAEAPVEKAKSYLCEVKVLKFYGNGEWLDAHGNAILYVQKDSASSNLLFGDRLMVEAEFKNHPELKILPDLIMPLI